MAAEDQCFLASDTDDSQAECVEPRPNGGKYRGRMLATLIGLGGGVLLVFAVLASQNGLASGGKVSALLELAGMGISSVCGSGEETEETTCAEEGSLIRSQGRAVAYMSDVGCTAWLVKSEISSTGALMLTTGHCAESVEETFIFDYVKPCGGGSNPSMDAKCKGTRKIAKIAEDEEAIYELEKPCHATHTRIPIHLDVGSPEVSEGIYIIGHPQRRPQQLSHEEVHDKGTHCTLTHVQAASSRRRVNARYYCDTQGGNSGSPVFSARTGFAVAIHKWGGCSSQKSQSGNGGTLLKQGSIKDSLRQLNIPFVDRGETDIMYQAQFTKTSNCEAMSLVIRDKSLEQCKATCLNSLSCTAVAHKSNDCYIAQVRGRTRFQCVSGAQYYTLGSRSLYRAPPGGTTPGGLCTNTCKHPRDGECDDGGANSHYNICKLGTDCHDCGVRFEKKKGKCENTCKYANDRECDDGGENSHYSLCDLGTDCDDCGEREAN